MAPLLSLQEVARRFGDRAALDGVTIAIGAGELVGLVGANGAGKSTLLRAAAGRIRLDQGTVTVVGHDPRHGVARRQMGFTPQEPALFPHLTVRENVEVFAGLAGLTRSEAGPAAARAVARVGLAAESEVRAQDLSGGMRKRASLAAGLAHRPAVVLADEPVAGVDLSARDHVHALLRSARDDGAAVLMATHDLEGAEEVADRVVVLDAGRVRADAAPADLVRDTLDGMRQVTILLHAPPSPAQSIVLASLELRSSPNARAFTGELRDGAALGPLLASLEAAGVHLQESRLREPGLRAALQRLTGRELA